MSKRKCGLCGKTKKLTKTECCNNWICDDEDNYVMFSYARNSCHRNHDRYTLCAYHYHEGHDEPDWRDCNECLGEDGTEMTNWYATNEYNFVKLENPPQYAPTYCKRCNQRIRLGEEGFAVAGDNYYCMPCSPFIDLRPTDRNAAPQAENLGPEGQQQAQEQPQPNMQVATRPRSQSQPIIQPQEESNIFEGSDSGSGLPLGFGDFELEDELGPDSDSESESYLEPGPRFEQADFNLALLDFINFIENMNEQLSDNQRGNSGRTGIGSTRQPNAAGITGAKNRSGGRKSAPARKSRAKSAKPSSKSRSPAKGGRKKAQKKWVFYGENSKDKSSLEGERGRSKKAPAKKASSSRANSASEQNKAKSVNKKTSRSRSKSNGQMKIENQGKYGKRKAKPAQQKTKKVKKNETNKGTRASSRSTNRNKNKVGASKKASTRTNSVNARSSSTEKPRQKKKVQGVKKRT